MPKHISIVPLIGGMSIGAEAALGSPPEAVFSYDAFALNDSFLMEWYKQRGLDIPYISLDQRPDYEPEFGEIDLVTSVCPCSGLSLANARAGAGCQQNHWMTKSSEWVLDKIKPKVLVGENAPNLYGNPGQPVAIRLREIGERFGYSLSLVKTSTYFHGIPQRRDRSFFIFFRDIKIPQMQRQEKFYEGHWTNFLDSFESDDSAGEHHKEAMSLAMFDLLEEVSGMTRKELSVILAKKRRSIFVELVVEYPEFRDDFIDKHIDNEETDYMNWRIAKNFKKVREKMAISGKCNVWDDTPRFNENQYFSSVMYKNVYAFWHPRELRPLTPREQMRLMGLPESMAVPRKYLNAICQNVPTCTAQWMIETALAATEKEDAKDLHGDGIFRFSNVNGSEEYGKVAGKHLLKMIEEEGIEFTPVEEELQLDSKVLVTA